MNNSHTQLNMEKKNKERVEKEMNRKKKKSERKASKMERKKGRELNN